LLPWGSCSRRLLKELRGLILNVRQRVFGAGEGKVLRHPCNRRELWRYNSKNQLAKLIK